MTPALLAAQALSRLEEFFFSVVKIITNFLSLAVYDTRGGDEEKLEQKFMASISQREKCKIEMENARRLIVDFRCQLTRCCERLLKRSLREFLLLCARGDEEEEILIWT